MSLSRIALGEGGACVHNPHDKRITPSLRVASYPLVERYDVIWIWMGNPEEADPLLIPDFGVHDDQKFRTVNDLIPVKGGYQLVCDNLLDLSHANYLHAALR